MSPFRRVIAGALSLALIALPTMASASSSVTYDFNTAGQLSSDFNSYVQSGSISQEASGGIGDSGAVHIGGTANGVYATKTSYSIGPVGSTYVFTAYMRSVGNSGYSGMGFTARTPSSGNASGTPYRPTDALGISVHGGGFVFHDGGNNYNGNWGGGVDAAITTVQASGVSALLNDGSPDDWYKVVFTAVRDSATTFDTEVKVWPVLSDGSLINTDPSAIFQFNNRPATGLIAAPKISSYFNLSGDRVYDFDNFQVDLSGGASIIEEGNPVVLTDSAVNNYGALVMEGTISDNGGSEITERGFVYGSSPDPTTSTNKVVVMGTNSSYATTTSVLSNGTYYVRAYAINENGTSYGANIEVTADDATTDYTGDGNFDNGGGAGGGTEGDGTTSLAATGVESNLALLMLAGLVFIATGVLARRRARS